MATISENPISFLRLPQVKLRTGLSRSTLYAKIQRGEFPAPINLGARAVGWVSSEIEDWIADRVNISRAAVTVRLPLGKRGL
jgi:prophage regulatory protein